jgi:hypothetical protein
MLWQRARLLGHSPSIEHHRWAEFILHQLHPISTTPAAHRCRWANPAIDWAGGSVLDSREKYVRLTGRLCVVTGVALLALAAAIAVGGQWPSAA